MRDTNITSGGDVTFNYVSGTGTLTDYAIIGFIPSDDGSITSIIYTQSAYSQSSDVDYSTVYKGHYYKLPASATSITCDVDITVVCLALSNVK
jgi:hypothetical protein